MCRPRWRRVPRPAWSSARASNAIACPTPRIASYRGLKAASARIASAYYGQPSQRTEDAGRDRHQRQDLDRLVAGAGLVEPAADAGAAVRRWSARWVSDAPRPPVPPTRTLLSALTATGLTTPDPGAAAGQPAPVRRRRRTRPARWRPRRSASTSTGSTAPRSIPPSSPTSRRTIWTTTARWTPTGAPRPACSRWPGLKAAVINIDDRQGRELLQSLDAQHARRLERLLRARRRGCRPATSRSTVTAWHSTWSRAQQRGHLATGLIGQYNVSNLLGVIAAMRTLGVPLAQCRARLRQPARRCPGACSACACPRHAAGGDRLCPHAGCAGQGAGRAAPAGRAARRPAVVRVRLRRQPRSGQARP